MKLEDTAAMSNSPLATYTRLSPNCTMPRKHDIDTVTIHCIVGQWTAKQGVDFFASAGRQASAYYVVGFDGSIGLCVEECNRAWTSGGKLTAGGMTGSQNDQRAITIEVASETAHPYAVTDKAMEALISLLVDICRRNPGIGRLRWEGDKALVGQVERQNMTVHRWFANKACPGDYLYNLHGQIAAEVNARLDAMEQAEKPTVDSTPSDWAKEGVDWATRNKLMAGDGKGDLMLHSPITREQFCVMLKRYHDERENLV